MENARLKPEYLTQFMIEDVEHARHRMQILVMKKGKTEAENVVRACFNIEFDLVFWCFSQYLLKSTDEKTKTQKQQFILPFPHK